LIKKKVTPTDLS